MIVATRPVHGSLQQALAADGFVFVRGPVMRSLLADLLPLADFDRFAASWNDLPLDTYMADGGRYRRRRHATYAAGGDAIVREPHQPHFQSREYNSLNGGIARWFEPVQPDIGAGETLTAILRFCDGLFGQLAPFGTAWHVEVHQFRIEARQGERGLPTPEGVHRDGVDYVLVLLVGRENIAQGETTIYASDDRDPERAALQGGSCESVALQGGRSLGSFTLAEPFDAALVDDHRVAHGVTPVEPIDPAAPAHRDVLVVTFRRK